MKRFVVGFLFSEPCDRVVLIEKRKPIWQLGRLNGVGGKVELRPSRRLESPQEAMAREFMEETGARAGPEEWECFCKLSDRKEAEVIVHFLRAFDTAALMDAATVERERIVKADPRALPSHVLPNLRWLIPLALDSGLVPPVRMRDAEIEPRAAAISGGSP